MTQYIDGVVEWPADQSMLLNLTRENLVIRGTLISKPNPGVTHRIWFRNIDDKLSVDTMSCDVLDTNIGVWVEEGGKLDLDGTEFLTDQIGHAHIHICAGQHSIKNVTIDGFGVPGKLGSYPLHFHECGDSSRGTVVENVTVRNSGRHAFVPHASHGITFTNCHAINVQDHAFWWDQNTQTVNNASNDIVFDGCTATDIGGGGPTTAGFVLGSGNGNIVRNCTATNIKPAGRPQAAGYSWSMHSSTWTFENNTATNCRNGILVWENDQNTHDVGPFTATDCDTGISHGAYKNHYHYHDCTLTRCGTGVNVIATSDAKQVMFTDVTIDGQGVGQYGITAGGHVLAGTNYPTTFTRCTVKNLTAGAPSVRLVTTPTRPAADWLAFNQCDLGPTPFVFDPGLPAGTRVDVNGVTIYPTGA